MLKREKDAMIDMVDKLFNGEIGGSVFECGYGLGYSANRILSHKPEKYVLCELNTDVYNQAVLDLPENVTIFNDSWQNVAKICSSFDYIFFDTFLIEGDPNPLFSELSNYPNLFHCKTRLVCYANEQIESQWFRDNFSNISWNSVISGGTTYNYPVLSGYKN